MKIYHLTEESIAPATLDDIKKILLALGPVIQEVPDEHVPQIKVSQLNGIGGFLSKDRFDSVIPFFEEFVEPTPEVE